MIQNQPLMFTLYRIGNIQIDDPYLTFFADTSFQERMSAANISLDEELDKMINILNRCLRGRKEDMRAGIHLCRGNAAVRSSRSPSTT